MSKRADASIEEMAVAFIESHAGIGSAAITFKSGFAGEVSKHAFVKQTFVGLLLRSSGMFTYHFIQDGVPFANAVANVAFNNDNKV